MREDQARAYLESLLSIHTGSEVVRDTDDDYPVVADGAELYVTVTDAPSAVVGFAARAVVDVAVTPELYVALNDQNRTQPFVKVVLEGEEIWVAVDLLADSLDNATFINAVHSVVAGARAAAHALADPHAGEVAVGVGVPTDQDETNLVHTPPS